MLENFGDVVATPFFAWLVFYFHTIERKTTEETILYLFSIGGLIADFSFTVLYFRKIGNLKIYITTAIYLFFVGVVFWKLRYGSYYGMLEDDV